MESELGHFACNRLRVQLDHEVTGSVRHPKRLAQPPAVTPIEPYALALEDEVPVHEDVLLKLDGRLVFAEHFEVEVDPTRLRPADVPRFVGNPARLLELTGWIPSTPLKSTLADLLEDWRARLA